MVTGFGQVLSGPVADIVLMGEEDNLSGLADGKQRLQYHTFRSASDALTTSSNITGQTTHGVACLLPARLAKSVPLHGKARCGLHLRLCGS